LIVGSRRDSGYPAGITGDTIPLHSRIISIADTFDALMSDRPYRKAFNKEEATKIMRESIGEHFDPVLFEYFEKAIDVQSHHYDKE
jgi:putative two-component system response regulator